MRYALASLLTLVCLSARAGEVDLPRNPSISPDGSTVVFSWRGDLWKVSSKGGHAVRLTAHPASDLRSAWSPDGRFLAFNSRRGGALNVFTMRPDGSEVRQVTHSDLGVVLGQFAHRGQTLTFHARIEGDVYRSSRPYLVRREGGPHRRLHDAFGSDAVISNDGLRALFVRGSSSWSRRGYRGPDSRDVWLYDFATAGFTRLTRWAGNDGMPHWAGADDVLFVSDRELERANVYRLDLRQRSKAPVRLTAFTDRDVADLDVSADGSTAVFVAWDTLYVLDLTRKGATPKPLKVTASEDEGDRLLKLDLSGEASEAALSPDGKTLAVIARGEVFVRALGDHQPTRRVTRSAAREQNLAWSPDGERLYFGSDRDGSDSIYMATVALTRDEVRKSYRETLGAGEPAQEDEKKEEDEDEPKEDEEAQKSGDEEPKKGDDAEGQPDDDEGQKKAKKKAKQAKPKQEDHGKRWRDALRFRIEPVVASTATQDREASPSPDGKRLAFRRGSGDLCLLDLKTREVRTVVKGWDAGLHWSWSPGGRWLAYSQQDRDFNSEVWVVDARGQGAPVNVTMHPDDDYAPVWAAEGRILFFLSSRQDDESDVWAVFLDRALERMARRDLEKELAAVSKRAKKAGPGKAPPEVKELDLEDAWRRLRRVTDWPGDERGLAATSRGQVVVGAEFEGKPALFRVDLDGSGRTRLASGVDFQQLAGSKAVVLARGRPSLVDVASGKTDRVGFAATLTVDLAAENSQKFREAARILAERFYHPTMKGLDWPALTERYHELAQRARTPDEFSEVASRLIGELNASHLGIYPPRESSPLSEPVGRLGVDLTPKLGGFLVTGVLRHGPADREGMRLVVGDRIVGVEREPLQPGETLDERLAGRVGKETLLSVVRTVEGRQPTELLILLTPVSSGEERDLRYRAWCAERARKVDEWSGGRIGYLHIRGMNMPSLVTFERDLYAAGYRKEGLLIDVRNNGGGWTADRVLASLMVRPHAYTVPRGADPDYTRGYPRGRLFIQRFTRPVNLLCNEKSFSNAEILSHAFKTLERGTLVGEQTYGGVISTGATRLVDGTRVRLPFRGWYLPDGTDMENNGAVPDLRVPQTPEDECAGYDRQLKAALDDLLRRLPERSQKSK